MLDAQTYLEHIRRDGELIASEAEGHLEAAVPTYGGNTIASLVQHIATFCRGVAYVAEHGDYDLEQMRVTFGDNVITDYRREHRRMVDALAARDPDEAAETWGPDQHVRFFYRRAAQELAVHGWDIGNAVGRPMPIDPTLAADGVDEMLVEFCGVWKIPGFTSPAAKFGGDGETFRLEPTDLPVNTTFAARPASFDYVDGDPDVTARGAASDLLLFLWGRVPPSALEVSGDASLLDRWQERVKI